jgi:microcystin-dependent protein
MSEPFLAEVKMWGLSFAPRGWAFCNGQLLSIAQNTALFSLVGTTYGGDGRTNFGLPNLQGRLPMHPGSGPGLTPRQLGEKGGVSAVTLAEQQTPSHTHTLSGSEEDGRENDPGGNAPGVGEQIYSTTAPTDTMSQDALALQGSGQSHTNQQPYLAINFCIALTGMYPSRS